MNFLGHVFVASWRRGASAAPYAFGAMLPDFAGMARARVLAVTHRETAEGIALHHETDEVFHSSPVFTALTEETRRALAAAGVRRGTSLAVAHVGPEILLDGWLLRRDRANGGEVGTLYASALAAGEGLFPHLEFRGDEEAERLGALLRRLRGYGLEGYEGVEAILDRLERALAPRDRLRILPEDRRAVRRGLLQCEAAVADRAEAWVAHLRGRLAPPRERVREPTSR